MPDLKELQSRWRYKTNLHKKKKARQIGSSLWVGGTGHWVHQDGKSPNLRPWHHKAVHSHSLLQAQWLSRAAIQGSRLFSSHASIFQFPAAEGERESWITSHQFFTRPLRLQPLGRS